MMQSFKLYIDDDRYAFPVPMSLQIPEGHLIRERAHDILSRSPHHRAVEVFVAATSLFKIARK